MRKNTICRWYDHDAEEAARFYARTFPDSTVSAVDLAPSDDPGGKAGDVLTVDFTVCGVPCLGLNGGDTFRHSEAFSFQIATDDQAETDRYWNAIVGNGGAESACDWCQDKWGLSWQVTPRVLTEAMAKGGDVAKRGFEAMMGWGRSTLPRSRRQYAARPRRNQRLRCRPGNLTRSGGVGDGRTSGVRRRVSHRLRRAEVGGTGSRLRTSVPAAE